FRLTRLVFFQERPPLRLSRDVRGVVKRGLEPAGQPARGYPLVVQQHTFERLLQQREFGRVSHRLPLWCRSSKLVPAFSSTERKRSWPSGKGLEPGADASAFAIFSSRIFACRSWFRQPTERASNGIVSILVMMRAIRSRIFSKFRCSSGSSDRVRWRQPLKHSRCLGQGSTVKLFMQKPYGVACSPSTSASR